MVAMGTLGHERVGTAGLSIGLKYELDEMIDATREHNPAALDDPGDTGTHRPGLDADRDDPPPQRKGTVEGIEG